MAALHIIAAYFCWQICDAFVPLPSFEHRPHIKQSSLQRMVSSGFSFSDGEQILVSLQKPMGILLEQDAGGPIIVMEVNQGGSADGAGVKIGDVLLAVQNASVENADLEEVLAFIGNAPKVINLRFLREKE